MEQADDDGIVETVIDGVQTFWAPCDRPLRAALTFRSGQADETYLTSGRSHLVEHLALFGLDDPAQHHNGHVDQTTTVFHTFGSPESVVDFLAHVCGQLSAPPLHRLTLERSVLAAERAGRAPSVSRLLAVWRFGAQGYGLVGSEALGEQLSTAEQVSAWAGERYTRENAVLWLSGPPPAGLRLDLPSGIRFAPPTPRSLVGRLPAWLCEDVGGIAMSSLMPRDSTTTTVLAAVEQRLHRRLRTQRAISYGPMVTYEPLSADLAHIVIFADSTPARRAELAEAFSELITSLSFTAGEDVLHERDHALQARLATARERPDDLRLTQLRSRTLDALHGRPHLTFQELAARDGEVTVEQWRKATIRLGTEALYVLPRSARLTETFGGAVPICATPAVSSRRRRRHRDHPLVPHQIMSTAEGVTRLLDGKPITVRYRDMVAAVRYPDGAVRLVGPDSTHLSIEPTLWRGGARLVAEVCERVDADRTVMMSPRRPVEVPRPGTTRWARGWARLRWPERRDVVAVLVAALGAFVLVAVGLLPELVAPIAMLTALICLLMLASWSQSG